MSKKNKYSTAGAIEMLELDEINVEDVVDSITTEEMERESISVSVIEEPMVPETKHGIIDFANFVNLRGEGGEIIDMLSKGTMVTLKRQVGDFYEVELKDGRNGYISLEFLTIQ